MTADLYRQMPPWDYEVTVYRSGVAEWIGMDHRLTFVIEDQKPRDRRSSSATDGTAGAYQQTR
jgi:hypothetical protein